MATKKQKELTPEEKFQLDMQTEVELARLQRQYRILERDRNSYTEQSSGKLGKQKKVIKILKKEHHEILTDLDVADSEANAKRDAKIVENLNNLLQEHNDFQGDIKKEKAYLNELDMQISIVMKKIIEVKATQVTEVQEQQRILEGGKTLEGLENKLDTAIKRFCMTLTENRKLREEIDHLLKERTQFNKMWEKLIKNLSQGKKFMLDLIEQATIAYDQREEWCQKLQALRNRAHADFMVHAQEMREMERNIDDENKLKEFLGIKGQKRIMRDLMEKECKKREKQRKEMEELLEHYKKLLEEIKDFMGESNIHSVADKFSQIEIENFGNFQYINALNKELEDLSDEMMHLQLEIDDQRKLNQIRTMNQEETVEKLKNELEASSKEATEAEKTLAQTEATLARTLDGIDKLFKICKCNSDPLLELLGDNNSINNYNALLYLRILENKISELIIGVYYKEKMVDKRKNKDSIIREDKIKHALLPLEKIVPRNPCPLCVEQAQVSDVIDTLQYVLNKQEVKIKLNETLEIPGIADVVHNVSACHLPKSREIIQRRYQ